MISRVLVANRAEIASRVFRTCRRLGIETVAVHSDADADLPYVREADAAVRLPGVAPADTYLRGDLLVDAARRAGADAIHPGYGFLSENAEFARTVLDAGLTWIGPRPESIEQMGSKILAKELMEKSGVPVLTSIHPEDAKPEHLPLLVKASAGGGGRGMRVVRDLAELSAEVEKAEAEARSAFGDSTVFVEQYVERGRHVEVQVWGDAEGNIAVLGERDCSIQRRHQKVVEEAPAPGKLSRGTRERLHAAARKAAEAISYRGAGTVEFLYDEERAEFWFLEMNTRLQVEHPVTEMVFHTDLVELQIRAAEGETSDVRYPDKPDGHAIEVRLYAEDPAHDYQPQSGVLTTFEIPTSAHVRVDTGFDSGNEVTTHYDAMLAKVVAYGSNRNVAARRLGDALRRARIHGLVTNRDLLVAILEDPDFLAGRVSTAFLDTFELPARAVDPGAPVAAALALAERAGRARAVQRGIPVAWRNVVSQPQRTEFSRRRRRRVVGRPGRLHRRRRRGRLGERHRGDPRGRRRADDVRRERERGRRRRRQPPRSRPADAGAAFRGPGRRGGQRQPARTDARNGGLGGRREGRPGGRGRRGPGPRGDEDAAHGDRPDSGHGHRDRCPARRPGGGR